MSQSPTAVSSFLGAKETKALALYDNPKLITDAALASSRVLTPGQRFDVSVSLSLPETRHNVDAGVFQVRAELLTARGEVIANATRPAMVNLDGYQFGMTQFIKIPEEGETYELFAPAQQTHVSCIIRSSPELNLENLRGRWVIARLQRCNRHKRKLVLEALPSQFYEEHFC